VVFFELQAIEMDLKLLKLGKDVDKLGRLLEKLPRSKTNTLFYNSCHIRSFFDKMFLITFVKNILNVVGILLQALKDLSKAIKLDPTPDLLHKRGTLIGSEIGSLYLIV
jgi:hypothetical protein